MPPTPGSTTPENKARHTYAPGNPKSAGSTPVPAGNLPYTKAALFALFFWLLWGDFCFTLLENCFKPILQIKLANDLKADPFIYGLCLTTFPGMLSFFMVPVISVRSDRHRGPWGRRIPFLLGATPFVCALLALLGFGNEVAAYLHAHILPHVAPNTVAIGTFCGLFLLFEVANLFLNTLFYYLFNDVVPRERFFKFTACMSVAAGLAHIFWQRYLLRYIDKSGPLNINLGFTHWPRVHDWPHWPAWQLHWHLADWVWYPKVMFVAIAGFFLVAFTLACLKIKEPSYAPPAPLPPGQSQIEKLAKSVRLLATECFGHRFFLILFITGTFDNLYTVLATWQIPMLKSMHVDFGILGPLGSNLTLISMGLALIAARWGDRWHPLPMMIVGVAGLVITAPIALLFLIPGLKPETYMWIRLAYLASHVPINIICTLSARPLSMRLLPRDRYGQFAAAAVMVRLLLSVILGSLLGAGFMELMKQVHHGSDYFMRYNFVWQMFFQVLTLLCYIWVYREWKKLGGKEHYTPPIITSKPPPDALSYRIVAQVAAVLFPLVSLAFLLVPAWAPLFLVPGRGRHPSAAVLLHTAQARVALVSLVFFGVVGWAGRRASARVRRQRDAGNATAARAASDVARRWLTFVVGTGLAWLVMAAGWYAWFAAVKH